MCSLYHRNVGSNGDRFCSSLVLVPIFAIPVPLRDVWMVMAISTPCAVGHRMYIRLRVYLIERLSVLFVSKYSGSPVATPTLPPR